MIEQIATVTRVEAGRVWVQASASACGGCAQQASCGTSALSQAMPQRQLCIDCGLPLQVGDRVKVAIADQQLLGATLILYGLPLLFSLLVSVLCSQLAVLTDWLPELALSSLLLGFWVIQRLYQAGWLHNRVEPIIIGLC